MKHGATLDDHWLLPEGVDELLPPRAAELERCRRTLLDLYAGWGYELVTPPLVEHLETLLTGTGRDLELETFKLTDPASGRLLGIRADMTPQVARLDARHFDHGRPARLCYLGSVLRARAHAPNGSRTPVQVGAELYGHSGIESDVEVLSLMLATLERLAVGDVHLDLGHVGVFRGLLRAARISGDAEANLLGALQRKAPEEVDAALACVEDRRVSAWIRALVDLNGGHEVLRRARDTLAGAPDEVHAALDSLTQLITALDDWGVRPPLHFDLCELFGYAYYTGVVFAALVPGAGQPVARGGRYDDIGASFGAARPATGFSADLKTLVAMSAGEQGPRPSGIAAPWSPAPKLREAVARLREQGEQVLLALPGTEATLRLSCDRQLVQRDGHWAVEPIVAG
jgi:ATP phosphoribosyltransferase regulatory subunit